LIGVHVPAFGVYTKVNQNTFLYYTGLKFIVKRFIPLSFLRCAPFFPQPTKLLASTAVFQGESAALTKLARELIKALRENPESFPEGKAAAVREQLRLF